MNYLLRHILTHLWSRAICKYILQQEENNKFRANSLLRLLIANTFISPSSSANTNKIKNRNTKIHGNMPGYKIPLKMMYSTLNKNLNEQEIINHLSLTKNVGTKSNLLALIRKMMLNTLNLIDFDLGKWFNENILSHILYVSIMRSINLKPTAANKNIH